MDTSFLDGQFWNVTGVIVAAVTLIVTIVIFTIQRNKKALSYELISRTSLLTTREKLAGSIKILFNDQEVENVKFIEIKVINTGNVGIPASDYERPIRFSFGEGTHILSAEIIETNPKALTINLAFNGNEIVVTPILMNGKDYFVFKTIVSDFIDNEIIIDTRIKDVKDVKKVEDGAQGILVASVGMVMALFGFIQVIKLDTKNDFEFSVENLLSVGLVVVGYMLMIYYLFRKNRMRRVLLRFLRR